jgi:hypothetical protein
MTMNEPKTPPKRPRTILLVLVAMIPFVITMAIGEAVAKAYLHHRFKHFDLSVQSAGQMAPHGYQLWYHPANYTSWTNITHYNNLGFRRFEDTAVRKPKGTLRIFFTGGSAALGAQANPATPYYAMSGQAEYSNDETISAYLEQILRKRHPNRKLEVINAATNWSQLHQQMIHYYRQLRSLEPDLIISMDGQNDALPIAPGRLNVWENAEQKVDILNNDVRMQLRPIIRRSHLLYLVAMLAFGTTATGKQPIDTKLVDAFKDRGIPPNFEAKMQAYYAANKASVDRAVGEYMSHLQHFDDALVRDGVRRLFLLQPEIVMDRTKPLTVIERAVRNHMHTTNLGHEHNLFRLIEERGEALRAERGFPFYSFLNIFEGVEDEVYTDYCHMTPVGNRLLAAELAALVEQKYPELFADIAPGAVVPQLGH